MKYKAQRFDSIFYLADFLNREGIDRKDIVSILRKETGLIELLYIEWEYDDR